MRYPQLKPVPSQRRTVDAFGGYNHNLRIGDGEFYDMQNLSSDLYPVLSPRSRRGFYARPASPQGLIAKQELCYVDAGSFVLRQTPIPMDLSTAAADCPKQLVSMGAYVIILPDKKYINTADPEDRGDIEACFTAASTVKVTLCTESGEGIENVTVSPAAPEDPENLSWWLDTSATPHCLKQYGAESGSWVTAVSTFAKLTAAGIGSAFREGDGITLSGITAAEDLNGTAVIHSRGEDYLVIPGLPERAATQEGGVTVARQMPLMDFVIECGNRLWGCRYGENSRGETVNELYASALGDFKNWNVFRGLSTDSYCASLGSDGAFTGAVSYLDCPHFFKENCLHRVYGRYPAAFQIQQTQCRGVQEGCHGSLAVVGETLFYKSRSGICAFDDSVPLEVSRPLGQIRYGKAVGGAIHSKYYVSMEEEGGGWHLFVYDTARGLWHREDDLHAAALCPFRGELYCIDGENRNILCLLGSGQQEGPVSWMAETGNLGLGEPEHKYLSALTLRLWLEKDAKLEILAQYDERDGWLHLCTIFGTGLRSFTVPIRPRRSDHFRLRLQGTGEAKLYGITKTISKGSALP